MIHMIWLMARWDVAVRQLYRSAALDAYISVDRSMDRPTSSPMFPADVRRADGRRGSDPVIQGAEITESMTTIEEERTVVASACWSWTESLNLVPME